MTRTSRSPRSPRTPHSPHGSEGWRLLLDGEAVGPWNMGVDEALLATAAETGLATVRFYGWRGPWLSLGYAQPGVATLRTRAEEAGVGWVRRTTGGRAVLHGADLSYAIAAPIGRLPAGVRASYSLVADALASAFSRLGIAVERGSKDLCAPGQAVFDCFAEPASDEFCIGGRKFCGSAQRRSEGALLQHGSIRLRPDPRDAVAACFTPGVPQGGTCLADEGFALEPGALAAALGRAFARTFGADLVPGSLDKAERAAAEHRCSEPASQSRSQ